MTSLTRQYHPGRRNNGACRGFQQEPTAAAWKRRLVLRLALAAALALLCHAWEWQWLRWVTTSALVQIAAALGIPMRRLGWDLIAVAGMHVQVVVSCTLVETILAALSLLWRSSLGAARNLLRLAVVAAALSVLNLFRLTIGLVGLNCGLPWWLAHDCILGVTFFAILVFVVRDWRRLETHSRPVRPAEFRLSKAAGPHPAALLQ